MHVQVRHGLPRLFAAIDDQPVAVRELELGGQLDGDQVQVAEQLAVGLGDAVVRGNHFLGDDQDVDGRLRIDVVEGEAHIVFVGDLRVDLAIDDLEKDVV